MQYRFIVPYRIEDTRAQLEPTATGVMSDHLAQSAEVRLKFLYGANVGGVGIRYLCDDLYLCGTALIVVILHP